MADDRARSFLERYVIARASHFTVGREQEQAHEAALVGKSIYRNIADVARNTEPDPFTLRQGDVGVQAQPAQANMRTPNPFNPNPQQPAAVPPKSAVRGSWASSARRLMGPRLHEEGGE